jgi:hypothetical protein
MDVEAVAADLDGFLEAARTPAFLRQLRKCNRRRVLLDPASKVVNALAVGHRYGTTSTVFVVVLDWPRSSVTVKVTTNVLAVANFFAGGIAPDAVVPSP